MSAKVDCEQLADFPRTAQNRVQDHPSSTACVQSNVFDQLVIAALPTGKVGLSIPHRPVPRPISGDGVFPAFKEKSGLMIQESDILFWQRNRIIMPEV
jgi:hypothetical protein